MKEFFKYLINVIGLSITVTFCSYIIVGNLNKPKSNTIIIWNDDEESIPTDGSLITLELIKGDTIYIGPYDKNAKPN